MNRESGQAPKSDEQPVGQIDWIRVTTAAIALAALGWAAWRHLVGDARQTPLAVGSYVPPFALLDLEKSERLLMSGQKGKILWLVFWSAESNLGREDLALLAPFWTRLRRHDCFSPVAAAVDFDRPDRVKSALSEIHATFPAYLAPSETLRRFGVRTSDPPLHVLVDAEGRIAVLARADNPGAIRRLAAQVQGWLDDLDPGGPSRFAMNPAIKVVMTPGRR